MTQLPIVDEDRARLAEARTLARRCLAPPASRAGALAVNADGGSFPGSAIQLATATGLSACAEQVALCAARASSAQPITRLYLWLPRTAGDHPCGRCLQVWRELAPDCHCLLQRGDEEPVWLDLDALLPHPFTRY
jgi:cytidine deaminase